MQTMLLVAKAFAEENRIRILSALRVGELCVCELVDALEVSQSTLSTHLQLIRAARLVNTRRDGKWTYYVIAPEAAPVVATLFEHFSNDLKKNSQLQEDNRRLKKRLALREKGECCVGFGCAKPARGKASA